MKKPRVSDPTLYRVVFYNGATSDGANWDADGRRIADAVDNERPTGTELDDLEDSKMVVDQLVADLLIRFPGADVYRWSEHDEGKLGVTLTDDDANLELVVEPVYVEATLWANAGTRPLATPADLQRISQAVGRTGLAAAFDPQLDRVVMFPEDGPAVIEELARSVGSPGTGEAETASTRPATPASTSTASATDAERALGRAEPKTGFFSRLFGRG